MRIASRLPTELQTRVVDLEPRLHINADGFRLGDAAQVIEWARANQLAILGGDAYRLAPDEAKPIHEGVEGWAFQRGEGESGEAFVRRACDASEAVLGRLRARNDAADVVVELVVQRIED